MRILNILFVLLLMGLSSQLFSGEVDGGCPDTYNGDVRAFDEKVESAAQATDDGASREDIEVEER